MAEWNQILLRKEYSPEKPDEIVVSLTSILEEREARRVLDLGCGAGRHVIHLAKRGFESYACMPTHPTSTSSSKKEDPQAV